MCRQSYHLYWDENGWVLHVFTDIHRRTVSFDANRSCIMGKIHTKLIIRIAKLIKTKLTGGAKKMIQ